MRRIAPSILALCALVAAALPVAAQASHSQSMTFEAPVDLANPATRTQAFDEISSFGVKSVRIVMLWQNVAPAPSSRVKPDFDATDPAAYNWSGYDAQVDGAVARGWKVLLTVSGPVPQWASNGARDNLTRPSPSEFQSFVTAAARHYGTKVARWAIWNEPNQPQFLLPQYSAGRHTPLSPRIYRNLFLAGQRGLRAGGLPNAQVLIGETSPRGTTHVVPPLTFLRGVFCLNSRYRKVGKCAQLHADGYAHHAYTTAQGPLFKPKQPNDVTIGVIGRLITALNRVRSAGAVDRRLTSTSRSSASSRRRTRSSASARPASPTTARSPSASPTTSRGSSPSRSTCCATTRPRRASRSRCATPASSPACARTPARRSPRSPASACRSRRCAAARGCRCGGSCGPRRRRPPRRSSTPRAARSRSCSRCTTDSRGYFTRNTTFRSGRRYRLVWTQPSGQSIHGTTTSVYKR